MADETTGLLVLAGAGVAAYFVYETWFAPAPAAAAPASTPATPPTTTTPITQNWNWARHFGGRMPVNSGGIPIEAPFGAGEGIQTPVLPIQPVALAAAPGASGFARYGLAGLARFRGMGQVSVGPLAQAQFAGQINPSFISPSPYVPQPGSVLQAIPTYDYPTQAFAQQIASLLGGSVTQAPPQGDYASQASNIPDAYWVQLPNGQLVAPGNLFLPGEILSFPDECAAEAFFEDSIPDSVLSAACAGGGTGTTPAQMALANSNLTPAQQIVASNAIAGGAIATPSPSVPAAPTTPAVPNIPAPSVCSLAEMLAGTCNQTGVPSIPNPITPGGSQNSIIPGAAPITPISSPGNIVNGTPGSNLGNVGAPAPASGSSTSTSSTSTNSSATSGCFNPLSALFGAGDFCLGPIGIVEAGIAIVLVLMMLPRGR
jgi:hypothetical protein